MKSFFDRSPVGVGLGLVVVAGLITTTSCAERKDQAAPAAGQAAPEATTTEITTDEVTHVVTSPEELAKLVTAATSGTGKDRYTAIDDLGERAADVTEVVPELEKNLSDTDPQVVWRSVRALGDYGEEAVTAAPALRKLLTNSDPILQLHAALALGKVGDKSEETIDALVTAVGSPDGRVSRAAVAALKQLKPGPVKVAQALKKAMMAQDSAVAAQALEAIVELGPQAVPLLNEALKEPTTAYMAAAAAEQIGPDAAGAVPELVAVLGKTKHSQLQIRVILALARIGAGAKSASPQILSVMKDSQDATVPVAGAFALGAIGATDADEALKSAAASDKPFLAMVAAWSLAKIHPDDAALKQQAIDKLNAGLKSADPAIQSAAEKGLKSLEAPATAATQ
jgi:HEAT repeat protein